MSNIFRYSTISQAQSCLRKYKFYLDGVKTDSLESGDMAFGKAIHLGLQAMLDGQDYASIFEGYWDSLASQNMKYTRIGKDELRKMGDTFLARFERLHLKKFGKDPVLEQTLVAPLTETYSLQGTPDCIAEFEGKLSVIDFKTANYEYNKKRILVNSQMPLYAHLAKSQLGLDITQLVYLVFIKNPSGPRIQTIVRDINSDDVKIVLDNTIDVCDDLIQRKTFPMNTANCLMGQYECEFFSKCHGSK